MPFLDVLVGAALGVAGATVTVLTGGVAAPAAATLAYGALIGGAAGQGQVLREVRW